MIKTILDRFGYILKSESDEKLRAVREMYERQLDEVQQKYSLSRAEVIALKKEDEEKKVIFAFDIGDPIPKSEEDRKMYVASVAGFYKDILEPKLKQMISVALNLLEESSNERDFDLTLKGVVYSFRELMKWGETMINEQVANQTENNQEESLEDKLKEATN